MQQVYSAYGLNLQSDVSLDAALTSGKTDIHIRYACVTAPKHIEEIEGGSFGLVDAMPYLRWNGVGVCLVQNKYTILVDPEPGVPDHLLSLFLLGPALTLLLQQRGYVILHGSAVDFDGKAVAFLGDSGAGKSTMAAAFHAYGRDVLADDLTVIKFDGEQPYVMPGPPQLRLLPESIRSLGHEGVQGCSTYMAFDKQVFTLTNSQCNKALPLHQVYVLSNYVEQVSQPIHRRSAFLTLARYYYLYAIALLKALKDEVQLLRCASLAKAVPVRYLRRYPPLTSLTAVDDLITKHLELGLVSNTRHEMF